MTYVKPSASAIRSQFVLEMAAGMVVGRTNLRQARVVLKEQGTADWALALYASSTDEGVERVVAGEDALGMMNPSAALTLAYRGTGTFAAPQPLRVVTVIPSFDRVVFTVKAETGLTAVEQIAERRLPLRIAVRTQRDHHLHAMLEYIAEAAGFSLEALRSWGGSLHPMGIGGPPRPGGEVLTALARGEIDAIFEEGIHGWLDAGLQAGLRALQFGAGTIATLEARGYRGATVTPAEYPRLPGDLLTLDFSGWPVFVRQDCDDALVEQMCEALVARRANVAWDEEGPLPVERMWYDQPETALDVPLHPAAERFWRSRYGGH